MLAALWTAVPFSTGAYLVVQLGHIAETVAGYGSGGILLWTLCMALGVGVGLFPVYANSILCGWLFGWLPGLVSAMISYTLAAGICSRISRRLFGPRVEAVISGDPEARAVRDALL